MLASASAAPAGDSKKCESKQKLDDYAKIARERQKKKPLVQQLMQKAAKTPEQAETIMAIAERRIDTEVSKEIDQMLERGEFFLCSGCNDPHCNSAKGIQKLTGNPTPSMKD